MPIYEYQGQQYEISDTDPDVAKSKILKYLASQEEPAPEYKPSPETGFIPSVKRGALGLQSLVADVLPAMAGRVGEKLGVQGAGEYATKQMQEAQEAQRYIQERYPSAVPSYTDIKSGGDFLTYVVESVGELIPSILPSIFTGGAAGVIGRGAVVAAKQAAEKTAMASAAKGLTEKEIKDLATEAGIEAAKRTALKYQAAGAVGGSAVQNVPEVYQNIAEVTGKEDLGAALLFGGFNSVLDAITPIALLRKAKGIGITDNELIGAWYKRAGKGVASGFLTEGATEAVQEMSSAAAEKFVDNNKNFFTPENFERFINAGLKGGIGGGAVSGVANIPFGQAKAAEPVTPAEPAAVTPTPETVAPVTAPALSLEEARAKIKGVAKKPEEEVIATEGGQDVTDRIDSTGGGAGVLVPSRRKGEGTPEDVAAPEQRGLVPAAKAAAVPGAREELQPGALTSKKVIHDKANDVWNYNDDKELVESAGPLTAIQHKSGVAKEQGISKTYIDNNQVTFALDNGGDIVVKFNKGATAVFINKPDKMMGVRPAESFYENINEIQQDNKTFGLDKLQDFLPPKLAKAIQNTAKAISSDTREVATADEFIKPFLKEAVDSDGYSAVWGEREKSAEQFKKSLKGEQDLTDAEKAAIAEEAAGELAGEVDPKVVATKLSETNKARKASGTKPTEVINKVVEDNKDVKDQPRRTATQERAIQLAQTYRQQQAALAAEINEDETLSKAERESAIAFQNYMLVGNNNIKSALNILAADMFDESGFNSNPYMPNIGGKYAELFYESLNPANKKFVDERVQFLKDQDKRLSKFRGEAKDKAKAETKAYEESVDAQFTKKELKKLDKFNKEAIERNKALLEEDKANLEAADETYGGTTTKLISSLMRGDLRAALQEIVDGPIDQFSRLDKMVASRLLKSNTLPALQVVPESEIGGAYGRYDAAIDVAYIGENHMNSHTVLHETLHGFTLAIIKAHNDKLINNPGVRELQALYDFIKTNHPELVEEYGMRNLAEFASEAMSRKSFQDKLNAIPYKRGNVFTQFARAVLELLGISPSDRFTALAQALISTEGILTEGRKLQVTSPPPATAPLAPKAAKAFKEPLKPKLFEYKSAEDYISSITGQPPTTTKRVRDAFTSVPGAKELVRLFQNERYPIKNWEDILAMANKMVYSGDNTTAIYTQISLSTGRAEDEFLVKIYNPSNALYKSIGEYAKAKNLSEDDALKQLQGIFVALHEQERRHAKYLMSVPLNAEAAEQRQNLLKLVRSNQIDEATARELRKDLETLVAGNKQEKGYGFNAEPSDFSLDENSDYYNVAGIRPEIRDEILAKYYSPDKAIIDPIKDALQVIHKATTELNKKANYWSQPVSNIVAFYNFDNYVPLKGRPDKKEKETKVDDLLDFSSRSNGSELQDKETAFAGRVSESENPLLQTLSDGVRSALRAGRGGTYVNTDGSTEQYGITLAVKNAIDQKLLDGKKLKTVQFEDRYEASQDELLTRGENTFFHYNPDGSIDIYSISDPKIREAIRRSYRASQPLLDAINNTTSLMGQMHTRYNVAFAPMNFIRDTLTNAFTMGAEMGPSTVGAVASKVAQGGLARAFKVANLYRKGEFAEIEKIAKSDPYVKAMYEYIQQGGKVSYVAGIGAETQFEQMQKNIGRKKIAATKSQIDGVIDIWTNAFEFASRTAAYQVVKENFMNGPEKLTEREAQVRAVAYVKNLANFEQVGAWGKSLGAIFMFFRPSATGAVRAIEALVPLFRNVDTAMANLPEAVRNDPEALAKFRENMASQKRAAAGMLMSLAGAGTMIYLMALALAEEDEEGRNKVAIDDLARWTRYARFHIPGTDTIFQIPWGFGLGAFASAGAQIVAFGLGNNSIKDTFNNIKDVGMDAFLPLPASRINMWENPAAWAMDSVTPSLFRPFFEYAMNLDGLGREIYNNRQTRSGDAYTGGDNIPEMYKDAAKLLANITNGGIDWSPNTMYFFANNYADGLTRLIHNSYNIGMVGTMQKDFNPKTDTLVFDSFFGAKSNFDAREFSKMENMIKDKERKLNMFKNDPERYMDYIAANPYDQGLVDIYNKGINGDLKKARELANRYRAMPDLTPKERKELLDNIKEQQNLIKRHLISVFKAYEELD